MRRLHRAAKLGDVPPGGLEEVRATELVPEQPGFIVVVPGVFAPFECDKLISVLLDVGLNPASEKDLRPRKNEAFLNRSSLAFEDPDFARGVLWPRIRPFVPDVDGKQPVGLHSRCRYYSYERGQRFEKHVDVSQYDDNKTLESHYTLLIYLNGETMDGKYPLEGGATVVVTTQPAIMKYKPD